MIEGILYSKNSLRNVMFIVVKIEGWLNSIKENEFGKMEVNFEGFGNKF